MTRAPFDDIRGLFGSFPPSHLESVHTVRSREKTLVKPVRGLGRLEEIAEWVAAWQGSAPPRIVRPQIAIYAAAHGIAERGVSAFPPEATQQMVETLAAGGMAVNQLVTSIGAGLKVFDLALDLPTADITKDAALSERDCAATIAFGMEAVAERPDLLCLGSLGVGSSAVAAALSAGLFGGQVPEWVGLGSGVDDERLQTKIETVEAAVECHRDHLDDPLEVLRRLGGREIAAVAGAILAARVERIPVLLDGYAVTAAAAVLHRIEPTALAHCRAAHVSSEPGHRRLLDELGLRPLFDLEIGVSDAAGGALAIQLIKSACEIHAGMATFEQAKVAKPIVQATI